MAARARGRRHPHGPGLEQHQAGDQHRDDDTCDDELFPARQMIAFSLEHGLIPYFLPCVGLPADGGSMRAEGWHIFSAG